MRKMTKNKKKKLPILTVVLISLAIIVVLVLAITIPKLSKSLTPYLVSSISPELYNVQQAIEREYPDIELKNIGEGTQTRSIIGGESTSSSHVSIIIRQKTGLDQNINYNVAKTTCETLEKEHKKYDKIIVRTETVSKLLSIIPFTQYLNLEISCPEIQEVENIFDQK